jgi:hypothetical protein
MGIKTRRRNAVTFLSPLGLFRNGCGVTAPKARAHLVIDPKKHKKIVITVPFFLVSQQAKKLVCTRCAGTTRRVERCTALLSISEDEQLGCGHIEHLRILIGPEATEIRPFSPKVARGLVVYCQLILTSIFWAAPRGTKR